jgi:hypothetical protein
MVDLIQCLSILQAAFYQLLDDVYTFLLELAQEAKQFEPVIRMNGVVNKSNISVLP